MRTPNPSKPHPTIVASADLHIVHHGDGWLCIACRLLRPPADVPLPTPASARIHLAKHDRAGHDTQGVTP